MFRLPIELFLALRYLRPKRTFVSAITLICVIGVMLGVAVLIIVISVMTGFDQQLRDKIIGFNAHLKVYHGDGLIRDYPEVVRTIQKHAEVVAASPFVLGQVMVKTQPLEGRPKVMAPVVRGCSPDPIQEAKISSIPSSLVSGTFDLSGSGVLVGKAFARKMGLQVGDLIAIFSVATMERMEQSRQDGEESAVLPDDYEVRGIFDVGYYEYNELFVVTSLANAQKLYGLDDSVHGIIVNVKDPERALVMRRELGKILGPDFVISTWMEDNGDILEALVVEKQVMFYLLFFIMIVAAFGITSAMITFVVQKTREIGVLKALGATNGQVLWLFLSQGLFVGVTGVVAGYFLGLLAVAYRNEFLHFMRRITGFQLFPESIYNFRDLPARVVPGDLAIICGASLVICVVAGLIPAWNASRLKPVEALRHE